MFSRTTMASSINNPTHSDSAIKVIMLTVKPNRFMKKKVPMMAMGKVRPVITVERQELRNRKTIKMVNSAPSIRVRRTFSTDTRMAREPSTICSSFTPGGNCAFMSVMVFNNPSTTWMVFSSCDFCTLMSSVRWPLYSARVSISCAPSRTFATCSTRTGTLFLRATMILPKSSGRCMRASIWMTFSCSAERMAPRGKS